MLKDPHHLLAEAYRLLETGNVPTSGDPKVQELILALQGKSLREGLDYAIDKYRTEDHRHYIESMLIGGGSLDMIHHSTDIPREVVDCYCTYIFDRDVFRDRLDKFTYVKQLSNAKIITEEHFKLYQSSLVIGPDVIAWRLKGELEDLKPASIIRRCLGDAMFRGLSHRLMPNVELTKNHVAWMKYTKELAAELAKIDPADEKEAAEALKVALRHEDNTVNAGTSGIPQDQILH